MSSRRGADVFIPCYNYGRFLASAVECALGQGGLPVRILIIDDTSTDDTPQIGAALAARHSEVSFRRHERNVGHIGTYNEGLAWAESEYFQFLSADDLLAPGALGRAAAIMDRHPDVGLVYGDTVRFDGAPPIVAADAVYDGSVIDGVEFIRRVAAGCRNPIANPASVLVRTAAQHEIGGYLPELPHSGDMEMWLRFATWGRIGILDGCQGFYRRHSSNMSLGYANVNDLVQRLMAFEAVCRRQPGPLGDALAVARRSVASEAFWVASCAFERGDDIKIEDYLAFSAAADPAWQQGPEWRKFRLKRLIGRRLSRWLRALFAVRAEPSWRSSP